jgi:hypothetical protein
MIESVKQVVGKGNSPASGLSGFQVAFRPSLEANKGVLDAENTVETPDQPVLGADH